MSVINLVPRNFYDRRDLVVVMKVPCVCCVIIQNLTTRTSTFTRNFVYCHRAPPSKNCRKQAERKNDPAERAVSLHSPPRACPVPRFSHGDFFCSHWSPPYEVSARGGGVLPEKFGGGVRPASQNPYPIYDQNLRFSLPYLWPDQKFDTLFVTVAADTVALNISFEGLLLMVLSIMMKK